MPESNIQPLLKVPEAAKFLNIGERTLFDRTKDGLVRAVRIGRCVRYSLDELKAYIERQQQTEGDA